MAATVVRTTPVDGVWDVELDDTIAYAESGGQPSDEATIDGEPVQSVRKRGGTILHRVASELEPGQEVSVAIDWERRFDFMQQHSAQHLLTALAEDQFGWPTTSFHLGQDYCAIELDTDEIRDGEVRALEDRANAAIRARLSIEDRWVTPEEYAELPVRSRGLPDGHSGDIRLVEIDGVDLNTCGGTHVRNTGELQCVHLYDHEPARGGMRLFFLAGERALDSLRSATELHRELSALLSVGPNDFVERIEKMEADRKEASRAAKWAEEQWAQSTGARLAASNGSFVTFELDDARPDLLAAVSSAADPQNSRLFVGVAGQGDCNFLVQGPDEVVAQIGPIVAQLLDGRGGGRGARFQGKGKRSGWGDVLTHLSESMP